MEQGECPVVFWDHEQGIAQQPEVIASSFSQWIMEVLKVLNP
jgi:hypothetical protein